MLSLFLLEKIKYQLSYDKTNPKGE